MRVLVTGGAGFIGANFLNLSVPVRRDVQFLNIDSLSYAANLESLRGIENDENYRFENVDITDAASLTRCLQEFRPNLIVHFAAESHVDRSIAGPAAFVRTNIEGTFNLLEASRHLPDQLNFLFHHVSTDEVYGSLGDTGLFTEETPYDPSSPYSASKASSDHLVRAYHRTYGLNVKITNCSNNYGPYQFPEKLIPLMICNALERKPLPIYGSGTNVRDWLYVSDHCDAIWQVISHGKIGETYNVGGNNELKNIEVVHMLCDLVAEQTNSAPEELRSLITHVKDRPGHDLRYAIDATKLRRECGFSPKEDTQSGFRKTVDWYLENSEWIEHVRSGAYRTWIEQNYTGRGEAS